MNRKAPDRSRKRSRLLSLRKKLLLGIAAVVVLGLLASLAMLSLFSKVPESIGVRDGRLAACPSSPNCVCSQDENQRHSIEPLAASHDTAADLDRLVRLIERLPRTRIANREESYLHVEFRSLILRFVDDVEFLVDRDGGLIHVRSASRVGYSDLGVNRRRVERIRALWNAAATD
jgi:uncharacterized protein (DUF1499 family)